MAIRFDFIGKMALIMLIAFAAPLQTNILAQGTAVTVVSDTTDDDEGNANQQLKAAEAFHLH